jgi:Domain of unknown function (DUF4287)/Domain of unknown function (DUF5655)
MSFQGYLDTIRAKTGLDPDDFRRLAADKGFDTADTKAGQIIDWLAQDYGLGRGHAMAIVSILKEPSRTTESTDNPADVLFTGPRAHWRGTWDRVWAHVSALGDDISIQPTQKYLGLARSGRKFAIVAATGDRFDIGFKLDKDAVVDGVSPAGSWNSMVSHRASVGAEDELTDDHLRLLTDAYQRAGR